MRRERDWRKSINKPEGGKAAFREAKSLPSIAPRAGSPVLSDRSLSDGWRWSVSGLSSMVATNFCGY